MFNLIFYLEIMVLEEKNIRVVWDNVCSSTEVGDTLVSVAIRTQKLLE